MLSFLFFFTKIFFLGVNWLPIQVMTTCILDLLQNSHPMIFFHQTLEVLILTKIILSKCPKKWVWDRWFLSFAYLNSFLSFFVVAVVVVVVYLVVRLILMQIQSNLPQTLKSLCNYILASGDTNNKFDVSWYLLTYRDSPITSQPTKD